jgi:hypothetical protein
VGRPARTSEAGDRGPYRPITAVRIATVGENSPLAAIIDTAKGLVFVKGLPSGHRRVITQAREVAVAPLVREISPVLLGTSTRPDGTFSVTSTSPTVTPITALGHLTLTGWCSSWAR